MKVRELEKIGRQLLPELPGFAAKKKLLFIQPIGHTLRAICFARSIDPRGFHAHMFVQPLFMPEQQCVVFNFGWRLDRGRVWNADATNLIADLGSTIRREAVPFLSRIHSARDVAEVGLSLERSGDLHTQ